MGLGVYITSQKVFFFSKNGRGNEKFHQTTSSQEIIKPKNIFLNTTDKKANDNTSDKRQYGSERK